MKRGWEAGPGGFAVPVALLLLLAMTALAHGALALARSEEATSRLAARLLEREMAVRGNLQGLARRPDTLPSLPLGGAAAWDAEPVSRVPPVRLRLERLDGELHLLTAVAVEGGAGAGVLLWALDPLTRTRGQRPDGDGGAGLTAVGGDPCASAREALEAPGASSAPESTPPGLGLLPPDTVLARPLLRVAGVVTPWPGDDPWACPTESALNWGALGPPSHPCAAHRPTVSAEGNLTVDGGEGQGVLAVSGDLTLRGVRYRGLVLAGGRVLLEGGARVWGGVGAAGGVGVAPGSELVYDRCAVYLALVSARELRAPLRLPDGPWVRPL